MKTKEEMMRKMKELNIKDEIESENNDKTENEEEVETEVITMTRKEYSEYSRKKNEEHDLNKKLYGFSSQVIRFREQRRTRPRDTSNHYILADDSNGDPLVTVIRRRYTPSARSEAIKDIPDCRLTFKYHSAIRINSSVLYYVLLVCLVFNQWINNRISERLVG